MGSDLTVRLIHNRRAAAIALCVTALFTALSFGGLVSHSQHKYHWLVDLQFLLPTWAVAALNLALYGYLIWLGVVFYRIARGMERVLVIGWFAGILLGPLENIFPVSAAIDYLSVVGMVLAFLAAVHIFLKISATNKSGRANNLSRIA